MRWLERPAGNYRSGKPGGGFFVALAAILILSGCSSVPDYANPVEWYNSTVDYFDDDAPPPLPAEEIPGANEPFPKLSATPEAPLREIRLGILDSIGEGLIADRANAQYTDEAIRSGGEAALAEPPTFEAEAEAELPRYQTQAPILEPDPIPALQPSTALPVPPIQSVTQPAPVYQAAPAAQPAPLQPVAVGRGIDVRTMFANLFTSSGPRAVAPGASKTQIATAPSTALPSSASLIAPGGGLTSTALPQAPAGQAAVIYFTYGSAHINSLGRDALHKVADYHKQSGGTLRVIGHASSKTKELSATRHGLVNFNISFKRARAVADELIRRGVSPDKLEIVAISDSSPAYREWMPSGEAGNRRAEVFVDY